MLIWLQVHRVSGAPRRPVCMRGLVLFFRCWRIAATLRHGRIAVRCDTSPTADVLAALDEPAQRVTPGMFLPGMPGRACEQAEPCNQRCYDDHDDYQDPDRGS
jgi:hypothetical protein